MVAQFKRQSYGSSSSVNNLPPQNIEAEESVLGGILLDPDAMPSVLAVRLEPNDFYIPAHKEIFQTAYDLFREGQPTDLMTVTARLFDHGQLDRVGGQHKLAQLVDRTVSAVNCDRYAMLIKEKFARRQIISAANQMAQEAYDNYRPLEEVMGAIEQRTAELASLPVDRKKDQFLEWQCNQVISRVRELEMSADLPAVKLIKKQRLADEFGFRGVKVLDEIYMSSLTAEEHEPAMTLAQLKEKYSHNDAPDWLHHGLIPAASVILLHALGGDGKTLLSYYLASLIAKGESWGEFTPTARKRRVLIVQVDEPAKNLIMRAEQLELGDLEIRFITKWQVESIPRLVSEIDNFKPDLVMIDSITGASKFSIYSENDVPFAKPLLLLRDIAQDKNVTFLVIHHSSKGAEGRGGTARGTSALVNAVSEVWNLSRVDPKDKANMQRIWSIEKSRSRRPCSYLLELSEDGQWDILGEYSGYSLKEEPEAPLRKRIIDHLKSRPNVYYKSEDLSEELGYSEDSLRKVLAALRSDCLIDYIPGKSGRGGYPSKYCFKMLISGNEFELAAIPGKNDGSEITHTQTDLRISGYSDPQKTKKVLQLAKKTVDQNSRECQESENPDPASVISDPPKNHQLDQNTAVDQNTFTPAPQPEIEQPTTIKEIVSWMKSSVIYGDTALAYKAFEAARGFDKQKITDNLLPSELGDFSHLVRLHKKGISPAMPTAEIVASLAGFNQQKFEAALKVATVDDLEIALANRRSPNSDQAKQIKARIEELVTGQPNLIT